MRVFDSNILIYHLNDALPLPVLHHVETWITDGAAVSVMTRMEVLGYPQTTDQLQQAMHLLAYFDEIPLLLCLARSQTLCPKITLMAPCLKQPLALL